jgi:hypothetical protein
MTTDHPFYFGICLARETVMLAGLVIGGNADRWSKAHALALHSPFPARARPVSQPAAITHQKAGSPRRLIDLVTQSPA